MKKIVGDATTRMATKHKAESLNTNCRPPGSTVNACFVLVESISQSCWSCMYITTPFMSLPKSSGTSKLCCTQPSATRSSHCSLRLTELMITAPNSSLELLQHGQLASKRSQMASGWLREVIRVRETLHTDTLRMARYVSALMK